MSANHTLELSALQALATSSVVLTYNADAPDTVDVSMLPEDYAALPWQYGDRVILTEGGRRVFSGTLMTSPASSVQAGAPEEVAIQIQSDLAILQQTVYAHLNAKGEPLYAGTGREYFVDAGAFAREVFEYATGWPGSKVASSLSVSVGGKIPTPSSNGCTSCGQLLETVLQWVPDALLVQRYDETGDTLHITTHGAFEPLSLPHNAPLQSVALTARPELVPPVCALVGGEHYKYPSDGDIREPGAFVYAVPIKRDGQNKGPAGSAPASQKMVIRGVPIPGRQQFQRGPEEYQSSTVIAGSKTERYIRAFFPAYAAFMAERDLSAGACVVTVVPAADLNDEADTPPADGTSADEDALPTPANYSDEPWNWSPDDEGGIYVMTEGSFNASSNSRKNLKGLRWCKASISMNVGLRKSEIKNAELPTVLELFPGLRKNDEGETVFYAQLKLEAVLINRRKRVYDPATNQPCRSDSEYSAEEDPNTPTTTEYRTALLNYYNASRTVYTDGSVALLHDGSLQPEMLVGRMLRLEGKRPEWATMNALVRTVAWDYGQRKLSLTVGSRDVLGFNEHLQRLMLQRMVGVEEARRQAIPRDVADTEAEAKAEADMSVSPSITAGLGVHSGGKYRTPWTLFPVATAGENGKSDSVWWLAGGTLRRGKFSANVADTPHQIKGGAPDENTGWTQGKRPKIRFYRGSDGFLTFDIYQEN